MGLEPVAGSWLPLVRDGGAGRGRLLCRFVRDKVKCLACHLGEAGEQGLRVGHWESLRLGATGPDRIGASGYAVECMGNRVGPVMEQTHDQNAKL